MKQKVKVLIILFLLGTFTLNSYAANPGTEKNQTRNVKGYNAVDASTGIDVFLSMGDEETVTVDANEDIISDVITEVKNSTLHIYIKNRRGFNLFNWRNYSSVKVYVTAVELNRIKASSGAEIRSENTFNGDEMNLDASSGGIVKADLVYKNLTLDASSGANLKLSGRTKYLEVSTSSGGTIDADELKAEFCKVNASSGGTVSVYTTTELNARASSGGSIRYTGNPQTKDIDKSSGGSVYSR